MIIQTAVEAEVEAFLGRARYQRVADCPDAREGSRNVYSDVTIKTTAGPVTVARPKLRGTTEAFASQLFGESVTKSNALEVLVIAGFVRGLSVRTRRRVKVIGRLPGEASCLLRRRRRLRGGEVRRGRRQLYSDI